MPQPPRVEKNTETRIFYASSAYAGAFSLPVPTGIPLVSQTCADQKCKQGKFMRSYIRGLGSTATPGCAQLTVEARNLMEGPASQSAEKCIQVSFRTRSCGRGIRSCSQMLEKWGFSPGLIWNANPSRSNSRHFPQTVQPRPSQLLPRCFNALSSAFKVSVNPSICFLVRRRSVFFSIDSNSR